LSPDEHVTPRTPRTAGTPHHAEPEDFLPLPHLALHVLVALSEEDRHGWAIVKRIEALTEGVWSPSAGSLYLSMMRLEEQALIEERAAPEAAVDERRRYYRLTALGRRVVQAELRRLASLVAATGGLRLADGPPDDR
jgi:DNA-binding PadR family transcriptional regulator